jgi:hypothetical protein
MARNQHALIERADATPSGLLIMTDDFTAPEGPSTVQQVIDGVQTTAQRLSEAVVTAKKPGMPLDVLAASVRQAPLAGLAVAFMMGVVFGRRRR